MAPQPVVRQWFVPGDGIAREVITADIQRYLGPDALVKPGRGTGEQQGLDGYWITAYRTLTSQMLQDLRSDSQRYAAEQQQSRGGRVAYENSQTHSARQHHGPTPAPDAYRQDNPGYVPPERPPAAGYPQANYGNPYGYQQQTPYPATPGHYIPTPQGYPTQPAAQPRTAYTPYSGPEATPAHSFTSHPQQSYYATAGIQPPSEPPSSRSPQTSTSYQQYPDPRYQTQGGRRRP